MKILFHSYNTCCQNKAGGVQVRIRKIHDLLNESGIRCDFFKPFETNIEDYDILHLFQLNVENVALAKCAKSKGLKVITSSIINTINGFKIDMYRYLMKFPIATLYRSMMEQALISDYIIAETYREADFLCKHFKIQKQKIKVIPNGIDEPAHASDIIFEKLGGSMKYLLQVGRFDNNKNQLNVIKALRNTEIDMVFIGGAPFSDVSGYYDKCIIASKGANNIHFLGWQEPKSELLMSAYKHTQALLLPSFYETFGLVALEAASFGAEVCLSKSLPIIDFGIFNQNLLFNPNDKKEILEIARNVYSLDKSKFDLKSRAFNIFSWENILKDHIECYEL